MLTISKNIKIVVIIIFVFFLSNTIASSQVYNKDSLKFRQYYKICTDFDPSRSEILKMADTLEVYAKNCREEKWVTLALFLKQNYYIRAGNIDSLLYWTNVIKQHTLKTKERNHYFLAWRKLANYYLDNRHFSLALKEIEQMPFKATEMNYIQGVIESYRMLSELYYHREIYDKTAEYMEKAISMDYEYNIKDYNITNKYFILALAYVELKQFDKAESCLEKGMENSKKNTMRQAIYRGYLKLYIETKDKDNARRIIDTLYLAKYKPELYQATISSLQAQYLYMIGDYEKAYNCYQKIKKMGKQNRYLSMEADCLYKMKKYKEAADILLEDSKFKDSLRMEDVRNDVYEQLAIIGVDSVNAERDKIATKLKGARLKYLSYGVILLVIVLGVFIFLTIKYIKLYRKLSKSEHARIEFLNHLSHEIRTPLNSIVGFSHLIAEENLSPEEKDKCADTISQCSDILLRMISSAAEMNSVDNIGKDEETDINELCKSILDSERDNAKTGVEVMMVPAEPSPIYTINRIKVCKVVSNMVNNAVKYTNVGRIVISPCVSNGILSITVTDTGPGIPKEKAETVFGYFVTLNDNIQGLGLGLSLSRQIAESLGGTLSLDSNYTEGCKIVFTLPLS